jgi:hypothetical protein
MEDYKKYPRRLRVFCEENNTKINVKLLNNLFNL